jgi:SagB-type dehydrogenase family enzyme
MTGPARPVVGEGTELHATVRLASVTGATAPETPDPTEDYHEASRIYPGVVDPSVVGAARLEQSVAMRVTATRSVKRHAHRPFTQLPRGALGEMTLRDALAARRSRRSYDAGSLHVAELGALLAASYGVTGTLEGAPQTLRSAPSGGALYPLELYVACRRVEGVARALHHYDPLRHGLEELRPLTGEHEVAALTPYDELVTGCAALIVVTGMLWRSRFKYGARAYRFTLMEAGHVAQSFLLAVEALGLAATPLGGFFDRRADAFVGVDGIHETALYLLPVGRRET